MPREDVERGGTVSVARRPVTVVVLAAGYGRRLAATGGPGPKWLLEVGGAPIAERHLVAVEQTLGPNADVVVIVGHAADRVERFCAGRADRSGLRPLLVANDRYAERNNWYSLLLALDVLETRLGPDHVVVVLNSDLFASPEWVGALLSAATEFDAGPGFLTVDLTRPLTNEAMKVAAGPSDAAGRRWCTDIGKVGITSPAGEYVGIAALAPRGRALVHEALRGFAADGDRSDAWYEDAFQKVGTVSPFLIVMPAPSSAWVEIDDPVDLRAAEGLATAAVTGRATANRPTSPPSPRPEPRAPGS